jgi:hypothetical protein
MIKPFTLHGLGLNPKKLLKIKLIHTINTHLKKWNEGKMTSGGGSANWLSLPLFKRRK